MKKDIDFIITRVNKLVIKNRVIIENSSKIDAGVAIK